MGRVEFVVRRFLFCIRCGMESGSCGRGSFFIRLERTVRLVVGRGFSVFFVRFFSFFLVVFRCCFRICLDVGFEGRVFGGGWFFW